MFKIKKLVQNSTKTASIEATGSAKVTEYVDSTYVEKKIDTSTIKVNARLINIRSSDHYSFTVQRLANKRTSTGSNGSFSIKVPCATIEANEDKLTEALKNVHGHIGYVINEGVNMLSEEERAKGEVIARQNYLRTKMASLLQDTVNANELVESYLTEKGEVYIPNTAQLELAIVCGIQSFEDQGESGGWRRNTYTFADGSMSPCWRSNLDLYGRKRVPLIEEDQISWALDQVFQIASSFEEAFKNLEITDAQDIVDAFCKWSETLEHKDYKVERVTLSDTQLHELDIKAAAYVRDLMKLN